MSHPLLTPKRPFINRWGLIPTSESDMGTHQLSTYGRCKLAHHRRYIAGERSPDADWALQGTLWHLAMAHEHAQFIEGTYLTAEAAIAKQAVLREEYVPFVQWVLSTLRSWRQKDPLGVYSGEWQVMAVEAELDVGDTGATCGLDLLLSKGARLKFVDHKTAGRIVPSLPYTFSRSSQFIAYNYIQSLMPAANRGGVFAAIVPKSKAKAGQFQDARIGRFPQTEKNYAKQWRRQAEEIREKRKEAAPAIPAPELSKACDGCEFRSYCFM